MQRAIHVFENGIRVYDDHLIPVQRERYKKRNVHEPEEEDIFVRIVRGLPASGCFVNVGSAIGYYLLLARKLSPTLQIHAVEPLERHRRFFAENVALNGMAMSDFVLHPEGVAPTAGEARFVDEGYSSSIKQGQAPPRASLWRRLFGGGSARPTPKLVTIQTVTLAGLLERIGRDVDLMQIDVQGLESGILKSAAAVLGAGRVKTFLIGTHGPQIHRACVESLTQGGYAIEHDQFDTREQPDGIIVASKGVRRL
jgi:FkbM family methyltransferase